MLFDSLALVSGVIVIIILVSISSVLATGMHRRRQWMRETDFFENARGTAVESQLERIRRAQRATDFLDDALRRTYYLLTLVSAIGLIGLPFLPLGPNARLITWLSLSGITFLGAFVLLLHWRGWSDDTDGQLRKKLRQAQERALGMRGLLVRDDLTGVYSLDYWLHELELKLGRRILRPIPVTCLMIEIEGLAELRLKQGNQLGDETLRRISQEISHNVRAHDLVCSYRGHRIAIALFRCPAKAGKRVGARIETNLARLILDGIDLRYGTKMNIIWECATLPGQASTPVQLLRLVETLLDVKRSLMPLLERSRPDEIA